MNILLDDQELNKQDFEEFFEVKGTYSVRDGVYNIYDVKGSVLLLKDVKTFPFKFGIVTEDFDCSDNNLTSLEGAPVEVGGDFDCSYNELTSLNGAPKKVGGDFDCSDNELSSLNGSPKEVEGNFDCSYNEHLPSNVLIKGGGEWWTLK